MPLTPTPGAPVLLVSVPDELLAGLPDEDQAAIRDAVGRVVTFVGVRPADQRAEVEFKDSLRNIHTIWVDLDRLRCR